jgi:hypothetical protein
MHYDKYLSILVSSDLLEFSFVSNGPNGEIKIVVQFNITENPTIYNLAFGNLLPDGTVDDTIKNNNKDRNKVLATVAAAIYEFTSKFIDKYIFFKGSTSQRTRLYRMVITNNLDELALDFNIYGVVIHNDGYTIQEFKKGVDYFGFMIKRKI